MYLTYRDALNIFMKRLPLNHQAGDVFVVDAEPFLRACIEALRANDDCSRATAVYYLNEFDDQGFAFCLEDIREAIRAADSDFPVHYQSFYQRFKGAAAMAEACLRSLDP